MSPLVSVIVPAYNVGKYIGATLDSLSRQTFKDFEIIVVDDCSTDNTVDSVIAFPDKRIRLIKQQKNLGVAEARNKGIENSKGEFIALLDSDDIAVKNRLERQVDILKNNPDIGMVGSYVRVIREDGTKTKRIWKRPTCKHEASMQLIFRNTLATSMMFRRDSVPDGLYRKIPVAEDYDFNVRFAERKKVVSIGEVLTLYRVRESGLTHSKQELMEAHVREIMRAQLETLGLQPTVYQLDLNRHIGGHTFETTATLLQDVEAWLTILQSANKNSGRFNTNDFDRVLAMEWFDVCDFGASIGPQAISIWKNSKFSKIWSPKNIVLARFFVKCQLRRARPPGDVAGRLT
jgi:glycosyltransferase involved in cell wall biosynthesis